jgi:DeoR family myo-inositol catabolism operon transcriptional repressor
MADPKFKRISEMEDYIRTQRNVSNEVLCKRYGISLQTLRRDLNYLVKKGNVKKVYGGAAWNKKTLSVAVRTFELRNTRCQEEKIRIGKAAAALVQNHSVIFVDSGTTSCMLVPYLKKDSDVTVITHSIAVVEMLQNEPSIKLIVLGGQYNHTTSSFMTDPATINFRFDACFIATVGIDEEACTNTDLQESRIKIYAMKHSSHRYLMADHTKFEDDGFNAFAKAEDFDAVITDGKVPDWLKTMQKEGKLQVITAKADK